MKRTLLTVCLLTMAAVASYAQSGTNKATATATTGISIVIPEQNGGDYTLSSMNFATRTNELNNVLSRGSVARAEGIYQEVDQLMNDIIAKTQSGAKTNADLATKVEQQKSLYSEIKKLSADLKENRESLKTKLAAFQDTI